jgi:hypothetical protein
VTFGLEAKEAGMPGYAPLRTEDYVVTDAFFGSPYLDVDEWRYSPDKALHYRFVHGGLTGTDTRFSCYFPPADEWQGRMLFPVEGGMGGYEDTCETIQGILLDQLGIGFRLGAYVVESNAGHVGVELDAKAGEDPSIYGYRAHAESARFSKHLAAQIYGRPPTSSFAYGGGGGGMRAQLCLENTDVWDAAAAYVGVAEAKDGSVFTTPESTRFLYSASPARFGCVLNVHRVLGARVHDVIDAVEPGGSGDPFAGLDSHQREELANLYRLGFPRGSEVLIPEPVGAGTAWAWLADAMIAEDPEYFQAFWSEPGYVGHDFPGLCAGDLVATTALAKRVVTAEELLAIADGLPGIGALARFMVGMKGASYPCAVELDRPVDGYLLGASMRIGSGPAKGRSLYVAGIAGTIVFVDGAGEAGTARLSGVAPGDELRIDNHNFLAFCYSYRHQTSAAAAGLSGDPTTLDGRAIFPQRPLPRAAALMGGPSSGVFSGKLMLLPGTNDATVWPSSAVSLLHHIQRVQGAHSADRVCLRWMEHAENLPGSFIPSGGGPAMTTRFIDYNPIVEQSLHDLAEWVETGVAPASTGYEYVGGRLRLSEDAEARAGIQAVLKATVNGRSRVVIQAGQAVTLSVSAVVPPGAGTVVGVAWDTDGTGNFDQRPDGVDGQASSLTVALSHTFATPGTYFPCVRVTSHRQADVAATTRLIPSLARVRVTVT